MSWDIQTASEEWLINVTERVEQEKGLIGGLYEGNHVVQLSDDIAVKYGNGVTSAEAATQQFASEHLDPNIVRVPRVYRFFTGPPRPDDWPWPKGYLFMEYVSGQNLQDLDLSVHTDIVPRVATTIAHLGQIKGGSIPGPVGTGKLRGYLWGDDGTKTVFNSVADMNAWINKRLALRDQAVDLSPHQLVLCHMDLCRRNMILTKKEQAHDDDDAEATIFLVDWDFFPRFFEVDTLSCLNPYDAPYMEPLINATKRLINLTEEEEELIESMLFVRAASLLYTFWRNG
ncbi:hypothetical protein VTN77DRAFT_2964 [Rasamsonia byssochlamydoides]|uniref:uncharacterized protein n=1 Tax=Rasamsonia byssochlamydoides TaxID=89139 RepID=UPI003741F537